MKTSLELLNRALEIRTASDWARTLDTVPSTITNAKRAKRLSPTLAGKFAIKLGENATQWVAIAALEAEPESSYKTELLRRITSVYFPLGAVVVFLPLVVSPQLTIIVLIDLA